MKSYIAVSLVNSQIVYAIDMPLLQDCFKVILLVNRVKAEAVAGNSG
jgi:hypothetical protein